MHRIELTHEQYEVLRQIIEFAATSDLPVWPSDAFIALQELEIIFSLFDDSPIPDNLKVHIED